MEKQKYPNGKSVQIIIKCSNDKIEYGSPAGCHPCYITIIQSRRQSPGFPYAFIDIATLHTFIDLHSCSLGDFLFYPHLVSRAVCFAMLLLAFASLHSRKSKLMT